MDDLPNELIQYIIQFVPLKQRIEIRLVSSRFRDNFFCHDLIEIKRGTVYNNNTINKKVIDRAIEIFGRIKINLNGCKTITDESVSRLGNVYSLNLSGCNNITDASVSKLGNVHTLNLWGCNKITDASIQLLRDKGVNVIR